MLISAAMAACASRLLPYLYMPAGAGMGSAPFQTGLLLPGWPGYNAGLSAGSYGPPAPWYPRLPTPPAQWHPWGLPLGPPRRPAGHGSGCPADSWPILLSAARGLHQSTGWPGWPGLPWPRPGPAPRPTPPYPPQPGHLGWVLSGLAPWAAD